MHLFFRTLGIWLNNDGVCWADAHLLAEFAIELRRLRKS